MWAGFVAFVTAGGVVLWFRTFLSEKRIILHERPSIPDTFPSDFLKHSFAGRALIELLKAKREKANQMRPARLAKWLRTSRENVSNTIDYLERVKFVEVTTLGTKRQVALTDLGERAAVWMEENYSPSILDYLERVYPHDAIVRLMKQRRKKSHKTEDSTN